MPCSFDTALTETLATGKGREEREKDAGKVERLRPQRALAGNIIFPPLPKRGRRERGGERKGRWFRQCSARLDAAAHYLTAHCLPREKGGKKGEGREKKKGKGGKGLRVSILSWIPRSFHSCHFWREKGGKEGEEGGGLRVLIRPNRRADGAPIAYHCIVSSIRAARPSEGEGERSVRIRFGHDLHFGRRRGREKKEERESAWGAYRAALLSLQIVGRKGKGEGKKKRGEGWGKNPRRWLG